MLEGGNLYIQDNVSMAKHDCSDEQKKNNSDKMGFFTTRCVRASDEELAIKEAIKLVEEEIIRKNIVRNVKDDPPYILPSQTGIVSFWRSLFIPSEGFTFYPHEPQTIKPDEAVNMDLLTNKRE